MNREVMMRRVARRLLEEQGAIGDQSKHVSAFVAAVERMVQAMSDVEAQWHGNAVAKLAGPGYPFDNSFDEVVFAAQEWADGIQERAPQHAGLMQHELSPDSVISPGSSSGETQEVFEDTFWKPLPNGSIRVWDSTDRWADPDDVTLQKDWEAVEGSRYRLEWAVDDFPGVFRKGDVVVYTIGDPPQELFESRLRTFSRATALREVSVSEGGFSLNVADTPLEVARAYAEERLPELDVLLPDFDENYLRLQSRLRAALDVPRVEMPVIEPEDMDEFDDALSTGRLDIFQPWVKGHLWTPTDITPEEGAEWVRLGWADGVDDDDTVPARVTRLPVSQLLPTQSQIWLEKLIGNIAAFGPPEPGSRILETTIITSPEGYILDGHHRYGQAMLSDPSLGMRALHVPLPIDTLLKVGRTYGNAIGNQQKA